MNAFIFIHQFIIFINNKHIDKKIYKIIKSKFVFCKNHNFLIYFKIIIMKLKTSSKIIVEKIDSLKSFENPDFNNDLSNIENIQ